MYSIQYITYSKHCPLYLPETDQYHYKSQRQYITINITPLTNIERQKVNSTWMNKRMTSQQCFNRIFHFILHTWNGSHSPFMDSKNPTKFCRQYVQCNQPIKSYIVCHQQKLYPLSYTRVDILCAIGVNKIYILLLWIEFWYVLRS